MKGAAMSYGENYWQDQGVSAGGNGDLDSTAKFDRDELVRGWRAYEASQPRVVPLLKFAARTDMGQVRENNEDKFDFYEPEEPGILRQRGSFYAVADGIGGALAGQIASEMMLKQVIAGYYDHPSPDLVTAMHESIVQANDRIYSLAQMIPERSGMGTTLVGATFVEDRVVVVQVGDSRAYLLRDGRITQVTHDHSWVEEQVRAGIMTRADAEMSPFRNVITRSIGAAPHVQPDFYEEQARVGDIWLLCSDGLTGYVQDDELRQIIGAQAPSEAARQLVELANARGGRDNITVFVLSVRDLLPYEIDSPSTAATTTGVEMSWNTRAADPALTPASAPLGAGNSVMTPTPPPEDRRRSGWRKLFGR
jgi:serine/threonine protein phosphatase PrpC